MNVALTRTRAWQDLHQHAGEMKSLRITDIVLNDPKRLENCQITLNGLRFNYALNRVTSKTIELLVKLAQQQKIEYWRAQMFAGEKINITENRAVLHTALRRKDGPVFLDGHDVMPDVKAVRERMGQFIAGIRENRRTGATRRPVRHIVNIGIGGSDLGPRLAVRALAACASGPQVHFVANADAFDLLSTLEKLDPAKTLFVVVSKTFTTQETLMNARTARQWIMNTLGEKAVKQHFVAVSANVDEAKKFGIAADNIFPMWDWVGGRFSLWSAVGLSAALALGMDNFIRMLDGAAAMDKHFQDAPLTQSMPALLALLGVWHRNFMEAPALAILPYSERLRDLPRYLQQLEMESNGKSVTRDGATADYATAPVIFGECGTVSQHSFHQWLHQGHDTIPADFIGIVEDDLHHSEHHRTILANMTAQAATLAFGSTETATPQDVYVGGRSGNLIMLDRLDPYCFGMLLALYEHKVFVQGIIWNINSFDQPGVELGKRMARDLECCTAPEGSTGAFTADIFRNLSSLS